MNESVGILQLWQQGDAVSRAVALLLLAMSVASWFYILGKGWMLRRVRRQAAPVLAAFWQAPTVEDGANSMQVVDGERVFAPLARAALEASAPGHDARHTVAAAVARPERVLRALREAINGSQRRLESGQVVLATIGSTSPFVGLLGTVWGIYHALSGIAAEGQVAIEQIAGPVGEALIMTAFGLAVAIPAVIAYNLHGRAIRQLTEQLDGFARDLLGLANAAPESMAGANGASVAAGA